MKIYGNSKSDGFSLFVVLIGALFVGGGFLLGNVSELTLIGSVVVFVAMIAAMLMVVRRFDVMSEVAPVAAAEQRDDHGVPVRMPNFPVRADTEAVATAIALPVIDKPKHAVETNTAV